jgi:AraC-like DNA-binding protein
MKVTLYKPQNTLLQRYIECFYTFRRTAEEESIKYIAFPSLYSMICLNAEAEIDVSGHNLTITHCPQNALQSSLICDFKYSGWIRYAGATDEIVIYFKPLGINAFLERDFNQYASSYFVEFAPFDDYRAAMTEVFSLDGDARRIAALENYWLSKHTGFEHPFLSAIVGEILDDGGASTIGENARATGISRPTLNKHFERHLGTTPSQFKKIARFRSAMRHHRQSRAAGNLADISCVADYFDQSHMIKDFKSLTTLSPKKFFSQISTLEDGHINWLFL